MPQLHTCSLCSTHLSVSCWYNKLEYRKLDGGCATSKVNTTHHNTGRGILHNINVVLSSQIITLSTFTFLNPGIKSSVVSALQSTLVAWRSEGRGGTAAAGDGAPDMRTKSRARRRSASLLPRGAQTDLRPCLRPSARCTSVPRYQPLISSIFHTFCISPNMIFRRQTPRNESKLGSQHV